MRFSRRQSLLALAGLWASPSWAAPARQAWPRGQATPPLRLPGMEDQMLDLTTLKGRPVLLNFWATWCDACRDEMPSLQLLDTQHEREGLVTWAVNFKESVGVIQRFQAQTDFDLTVLRDASGQASKSWGVRAFPTSILIGRDGQARWRIEGEVDWQQAPARQWIQDLIKDTR